MRISDWSSDVCSSDLHGGSGAMTADRLWLHSYWSSSAAYRVRIGLNLKGLTYDIAPVHLVRDGGEQHRTEYAQINPQQERKSGVSGKDVAVRVAHGCRRKNKKERERIKKNKSI